MRKILSLRTVLCDGRYKTHQNWLPETEEQKRGWASKAASLGIIEKPMRVFWEWQQFRLYNPISHIIKLIL